MVSMASLDIVSLSTGFEKLMNIMFGKKLLWLVPIDQGWIVGGTMHGHPWIDRFVLYGQTLSSWP